MTHPPGTFISLVKMGPEGLGKCPGAKRDLAQAPEDRSLKVTGQTPPGGLGQRAGGSLPFARDSPRLYTLRIGEEAPGQKLGLGQWAQMSGLSSREMGKV